MQELREHLRNAKKALDKANSFTQAAYHVAHEINNRNIKENIESEIKHLILNLLDLGTNIFNNEEFIKETLKESKDK